jgi:hypothetical protein
MGGKLSISRNGREVFDSSNGREIKESTVRLMRSLLLSMQTFDSLPGELFIYLKLAYYPGVTPEDYHPHGFMQTQPNTYKFARENSLKFIVGQVHTPYHSVGMHVKSLFCQEWKPNGEDKEIDVSQTEDGTNIRQSQKPLTKASTPPETQTLRKDKKLPGTEKAVGHGLALSMCEETSYLPVIVEYTEKESANSSFQSEFNR